MRSYILGTGYFNPKPEDTSFLTLWRDALDRYAFPTKIVMISVGNSLPINSPELIGIDVVDLPGNLGHVHDLLHRRKPHSFCGWSMAFLSLAMIAYQNETDFIFLEQDCLAIGPWVDQAYADMGTGDMVFGGKMKTKPYMPCAQALVLVRHSFIPEMVAAYLSMGTDASEVNLPEHKFAKLERRFGNKIRHLSFGVDRERPIPIDARVFYAQKLTDGEIAALALAGRI